MKRLIIFSLILSYISFAIDNKQLREFFSKKNIIMEAQITNVKTKRKNIRMSEKYLSVFGVTNSESLLGEVYIYDFDGKLLWNKQFRGIRDVISANDAEKIVVVHDIGRYGEYAYNSGFDNFGNQLWSIKLQLPGIVNISDDGKYGINSYDLSEGSSFRLFDLEKGEELKTPIPQFGSRGFQTGFINNETVFIIIKNLSVTHNKNALIQAGRTKRPNQLNPRSGGKSVWNTVEYPSLLIVYNIPMQTIVTQKELITSDGDSLFIPISDNIYAMVTNDKNHILVVLMKNKQLEIVKMNLDGTILWENNDVIKLTSNRIPPYINDMYDVGNGSFIVSEEGPSFHMIRISDGSTIWRHYVEGIENTFINAIFVEGSKLFLNTSHYDWPSTMHSLDIVSGETLSEPQNMESSIILNKRDRTVLYDNSKKQLQFIK